MMSVAKKISKVMEKVQYLKKDGKVSYGRTSYAYLSEEKITQELNKAFREVGLIIYPSKMDIAKNEGNIAQIVATYRIQDTESDEYIEVQTIGEGQDKGDKKMNKAMTAAFKYAQRQSFMIPTGDDPDHISTEELNDNKKDNKAQINYSAAIRKLAKEDSDIMNTVKSKLEKLNKNKLDQLSQKKLEKLYKDVS